MSCRREAHQMSPAIASRAYCGGSGSVRQWSAVFSLERLDRHHLVFCKVWERRMRFGQVLGGS